MILSSPRLSSSFLPASSMIATLSTSSVPMSSTKDFNAAGAPLPFVPRRNSSTRSSAAPITPSSHHRTGSVKIHVQQAIPPKEEEDQSSSSSSSSSGSSTGHHHSSRPKRIRGVRIPIPESFTPSANSNTKTDMYAFPSKVADSDAEDDLKPSAVLAKVEQPLAAAAVATPVRLNLDGISTRAKSTPSPMLMMTPIRPETKSAPIDTPIPSVIRKKSGQLVKPSLKTSKSAFQGSLTISTTRGFAYTKSEPATPTVKAVHFDSQLEHVKLFLAEQRPIAVSRDGSPTDETSGTESDFPSWIYGGKSNPKKKLIMEVVNMPPSINLQADIVLEELKLSPEGNSLIGRVRVRNLDFQKWVAVRFTLDSWQTTSEVTAKYVESCPDNIDVFTFGIRLNDMLGRIDEKTLVMALRYHVGGREIWDNNWGGNYIVKFSWEALPPPPPPPAAARFSSGGSDSGSDIGGDLKSRLEQVIQKRGQNLEDEDNLSLWDRNFDFKKAASFSARYDIGSHFKNPWRQPSSNPQHQRMHSHPHVSSIPWPEQFTKPKLPKINASLGSPRAVDDDEMFRPVPHVPSEVDITSPPEQRTHRNHTRGYFDVSTLGNGSGVKRTPPGSRRSSFAVGDEDNKGQLTSSARSHSFPPIDGSSSRLKGAGLDITTIRPELESASESSATSDSSSLSSPSDDSLSSSATAVSPGSPSYDGLNPKTSYSEFLDKFCFFTGANENPYFNVLPPGSVSSSRTSSMSSDDCISKPSRIHDALATLLSSPPSGVLQTRDDSAILSGSSTPVSSSFGSRCPTPVAH